MTVVRVAAGLVCAAYLGALVYVFPTPHDPFGHWIFERNVFAAVCVIAWVALEVGLARLGSGLVSTVLSSTVASLPWAVAVLGALRATIGSSQVLPGTEPAFERSFFGFELALYSLTFGLFASAMLYARAAVLDASPARLSRGARIALGCVVLPTFLYAACTLTPVWLAAPLGLAAFALLRHTTLASALIHGASFTLVIAAAQSDECIDLLSVLSLDGLAASAPRWPEPWLLAPAWMPAIAVLFAARRDALSRHVLAPGIVIAAIALGHVALFASMRGVVRDADWLLAPAAFEPVSVEGERPLRFAPSFIGLDGELSRGPGPELELWAGVAVDRRVSWKRLRSVLEATVVGRLAHITFAGRQIQRSDPAASMCRVLGAAELPHWAAFDVLLSRRASLPVSAPGACRRVEEGIEVSTLEGAVVVREGASIGVRPGDDEPFERVAEHARSLIRCGLKPVLIIPRERSGG